MKKYRNLVVCVIAFLSAFVILFTALPLSAFADVESISDEKRRFTVYQADAYANDYFFALDDGEESFAQMYLTALKDDKWLQAAIHTWEVYRIVDESDFDSGLISKKDMYTLAIFDILNISGADDPEIDPTTALGISTRFVTLVSDLTESVLDKKVDISIDNIHIDLNKSTFKNIEFNKGLKDLNAKAKVKLSAETYNTVLDYIGYCEDIYDVIMMYAGYAIISEMDQGVHNLLYSIYQDSENPWNLRWAAYECISHFDTAYSDVKSQILTGALTIVDNSFKFILEKVWDEAWNGWIAKAGFAGMVYGVKGIRFLTNSIFDLDERNRIYYQLVACVNLEKAVNRAMIDCRTVFNKTNSYNDAVAFLNAVEVYKRCVLLGYDYSVELLENEAKTPWKKKKALEQVKAVKNSKSLKKSVYNQVDSLVAKNYERGYGQEILFSHINWPSNHVQGTSLTMTGVVTSTIAPIETLKCEVFEAATNIVVQSGTSTFENPSYRYDINTTLDGKISLSNLEIGKYYMVYTAYDTKGNTQTHETPTFNVVANDTDVTTKDVADIIGSTIPHIPSNVMIKQATGDTCTLASTVMVMRYAAYLFGEDYSSITESAVKNVGWINDVGLRFDFSYGKYTISCESIKTYTLEEKRATLINLLQEHPEGVALYNGTHCVWLMGFQDGEFYCVDPGRGMASGVILLSDAYSVRISNSIQYWFLTSPDIMPSSPSSERRPANVTDYSYSADYCSGSYYSALQNVTLCGNQRQDIVNVARSQIGYHEGNNTSHLDGNYTSGSSNVTEYGYWFGVVEKNTTNGFYYDWCAMFVSWCARQAGISTSVISNATYAKAANEGACFKNLVFREKGTYTPVPGDLIFFDWDKNSTWDHVGIVSKVSGGYVTFIDGNSSSESVRERSLSLDYWEIRGYGIPTYKQTSNEPNNITFSNINIPEHSLQREGYSVHEMGTYFEMRGTVSATTANIVSLRADVINVQTGKVNLGDTAYMNSRSVNIYDTVNLLIPFQVLPEGEYYIKYTATDENGKTATKNTDTFWVLSRASRPTIKELHVDDNNHIIVSWDPVSYVTVYSVFLVSLDGSVHEYVREVVAPATSLDLGYFEPGEYYFELMTLNHYDKFDTYSTSTYQGITVEGKTHTHNIEIMPAVLPTCTETGITEGRRCSTCGEVLVAQSVIPAKGHTPGAAANCATAQTCITCGTIISAKLDHNYTTQVTAPTCTESGYTTHTCTHCGDTYTDNEIPSKGHTPVVVPEVYPTPESEGLTEGSVCQECGDILIPQEPIPKQDIITGSVNAGGVTIFFTINFVTGDMTIQGDGTGEMGNYTGICNDREFIWYKYEKYIKRIIVEESVTSVGDYAFFGLSTLKEVVLPDGVTYIGFAAFSGCSSLVSITIPSTVTLIDEAAFCNCSALKSIALPDSVVQLNASAFYGCTALNNVTLSSGLHEIAGYAFFGCTALESIMIPNQVVSIGDAAFMGCKSLKQVTLPVGLTTIGNDTFNKCEGITEITLPDSISSIGRAAFSGCISLKRIIIPYGVMNIGSAAFSFCSSLMECDLPVGLKQISEKLFYGCVSLSRVTIPDTVMSIESQAFESCESLTKVDIPDGVMTIKDSVFRHCTSLVSVSLPTTLKSVWGCAFDYCPALTFAKYNGTEEEWNREVTVNQNAMHDDCNQSLKTALTFHIHSYTSKVVIEEYFSSYATCTTPATYYYSCSCGEMGTVTFTHGTTIPHTEESVPAIPATCTDLGKTEGSKCSVCGEILVKQNTVAPLGHTETAIPAKEATCTESGLTAGTRCEVCGDTLISQKEIPAKGHAEVIDPAKAPTCTETGLTEGKHCSTCDEILVAQTEVVATGHAPGDWTTTVEPAIGTEGKKQQFCNVCGAVLNEETIPALPEETEPVTDPETEPETYPVTEPDTAPETQPEPETDPVTEAPTEAPSDDPAITEDSTAEELSTTPTVTVGCNGSILSCGLLMLIALAGAALIKRKE